MKIHSHLSKTRKHDFCVESNKIKGEKKDPIFFGRSFKSVFYSSFLYGLFFSRLFLF